MSQLRSFLWSPCQGRAERNGQPVGIKPTQPAEVDTTSCEPAEESTHSAGVVREVVLELRLAAGRVHARVSSNLVSQVSRCEERHARVELVDRRRHNLHLGQNCHGVQLGLEHVLEGDHARVGDWDA